MQAGISRRRRPTQSGGVCLFLFRACTKQHGRGREEGGYIGESTKSEIEYAQRNGKEVYYSSELIPLSAIIPSGSISSTSHLGGMYRLSVGVIIKLSIDYWVRFNHDSCSSMRRKTRISPTKESGKVKVPSDW